MKWALPAILILGMSLLAAEDTTVPPTNGDGTIEALLEHTSWRPVYSALLATLDAQPDKSWEMYQDADDPVDQNTKRLVRETSESLLAVITFKKKDIKSGVVFDQILEIRDTNLDGVPDEFWNSLVELPPDPEEELLDNGFTRITDDVRYTTILRWWNFVVGVATSDLARRGGSTRPWRIR